MNLLNLTNILELILLAGVMLILIRFIFMNYTGRVRKPQEWLNALKEKRISPELLRQERKYGDRIRFYNIWLQIERLKKDGTPGEFAEVGVYKAKTAKIIHLCDPERQLHLFDTFEGFADTDLIDESGKAATYTSRHFSDTSPQKVIAYMGEIPNIYIHKGYFPDTTKGLEEKIFTFVSIDVDLHKPTRAALEFFYPRLAEGGVILIHDYNTDWPELMKVVDEFCKSNDELLIPIPDADSTVMIIKRK